MGLRYLSSLRLNAILGTASAQTHFRPYSVSFEDRALFNYMENNSFYALY